MNSHLNDEQRRRVQELFHRLADIPAADREAALLRECPDDPAVRGELLELCALVDVESSATAPEELLQRAVGNALAFAAVLSPGETVGDYRIARLIAQGGMGAVYEAEQQNPRRRVALKLVRPELVSEHALRRFRYEADLLGRLEHPGIARVYHAGIASTSLGRQPFFAMEFVEGVPLTAYAQSRGLSRDQRLRLLVDVCAAVYHAHTKGVIHRDLKPSNILVTSDGQVKVLDFGVARSTDADLRATTTATFQTQTGQLIGTLPYMSPEQAAGQVRELDTSSDVYALGVIAYELLAGQMPYSLEGKSIFEALRMICHEEPSRMSSIDRSLRGDVQTVVSKALAKEKQRRYQTAGEFAEDVKRVLTYEPILARAPSTWYQLSRFARRNKLLVGATCVLLVVLACATVLSTLLAIHAREQERQAQTAKAHADEQVAMATAVTAFQSAMLASADPDRLLGDKVTVLQATQAAIAELNGGALRHRPLVEAAVRHAIGVTMYSLGRLDEARTAHEAALALRRRNLPEFSAEIAVSTNELAMVLDEQEKFDDARRMYDEALAIRTRIRPAGHPEVIEVLSNRGLLAQKQGKLAEAEQQFREVLRILSTAHPDGHLDTATVMNNLAILLKTQGKYAEAESLHYSALAIRQKLLLPEHADIALSRHNLAALLYSQGKFEQALALLRQALESMTRVLPHDHPQVARTLDSLGWLLREQGKLDEAEHVIREALRIRRATLSPEHTDIARSLSSLAALLKDMDRHAEAETLARQAVQTYRDALGSEHTSFAHSLHNLGSILQGSGKPAEAEGAYRDALSVHRKISGPSHPSLLQTISALARVMHTQGRVADAEPLFAELYASLQQSQVAPGTAATYALDYAKLLIESGRDTDAEGPLNLALQRLEHAGQKGNRQWRAAATSLADLYVRTDRPSEAARWRAEATTQPAAAAR